MPSLTTYQALKDAVGLWLNRESDPDIDTRAAQFIELGEARIRRNQEWFAQIFSLENGTSLTVVGNPTELPNHVRTVLNLWASTDAWKHTIELLPISAWRDLTATNRDAAGIPTKAVIVPQMDKWMKDDGTRAGPQLYLWPQPGLDPTQNPFAVDFQYIRDVDPLSEDAQTNGMFLRYPDLYLYAALAESAPFYQHDERLQLWEARYQQAVKDINIERERAEFGSAAKRVRLPRSF